MNQDKDMLLVYWQRAKASGMLEEDEKAFPSGQMLNVMVYWLLFFHWYGLIWYLVITVTIEYYRLCDLEFCSNAGDDQPHALGYTQTQTKSVHT